MKRIIQICLCTAAAVTLTLATVPADAGSVLYKWTNEKGNTVHSDRPPPTGTPYEVISTSSNLMRRVKPDEGAVPPEIVPKPGNEFEPTEAQPRPVKKNPEQCKRARENLAVLNSKARIRIRDDQGQVRPLSEEEKEDQRQQATDAITRHCD